MNELARPFLRLWEWVDQVGGYPGKVVFVVGIIMLIIGTLTWLGNRR